MSAVWMVGILSQVPPKDYPPFESIVGGESSKAKAKRDDPQEALANGKAWGAVFQAMNKNVAKPAME